jgi:hypothetical protein
MQRATAKWDEFTCMPRRFWSFRDWPSLRPTRAEKSWYSSGVMLRMSATFSKRSIVTICRVYSSSRHSRSKAPTSVRASRAVTSGGGGCSCCRGGEGRGGSSAAAEGGRAATTTAGARSGGGLAARTGGEAAATARSGAAAARWGEAGGAVRAARIQLRHWSRTATESASSSSAFSPPCQF